MKIRSHIVLSLLLLLSTAGYARRGNTEQDREIVNRVAEWQMRTYLERKPTAYPKPLSELSWINGALFRGLVEWGRFDGSTECLEFVRRVGEEYGWQLQTNQYHADHICTGQAYSQLYKIYQDPAMIVAVRERLEYILANQSTQEMDFTKGHERWTWCDALFMAPPVWTAMYTITGDTRYLDFMDREYKATVDHLYDPAHGLFYRDVRYMPKREKNGAPIFWGRGNGWVFASLPLILQDMPKDRESYGYYVELFREMADAVLRCQDAEGSWRTSMLDHETYRSAENSGSGFFLYGLAWGINNGILKGGKYKKAVRKGWEAIKSHVNEEGRLGRVQVVAAAPQDPKPEQSQHYGVGAFLLAGMEIIKMNR